MENTKKKGISNFIKSALSIFFVGIAVLILINVIVAKFNNEIPRIFGYSAHLVVTDSMAPEINVGDLIIAKKVDQSTIEVGDDIVFITTDPKLHGITIIHRVVRINDDGSFVTQGIKFGAPVDTYPVKKVEGILVVKSGFLGAVFSFIFRIETIVYVIIISVLIYISYKLIRRIIRISKQTRTESEDK